MKQITYNGYPEDAPTVDEWLVDAWERMTTGGCRVQM